MNNHAWVDFQGIPLLFVTLLLTVIWLLSTLESSLNEPSSWLSARVTSHSMAWQIIPSSIKMNSLARHKTFATKAVSLGTHSEQEKKDKIGLKSTSKTTLTIVIYLPAVDALNDSVLDFHRHVTATDFYEI